MSVRERLEADMKDALRTRDRVRLETIRGARGAIRNKEIEVGSALDENAVLRVLRTLVKQREESIEQYRSAGTMVRELLRASKLQDIDSVGEWHNRVQTSITKADEDGAHASVMTGHRMIGQSIGAVQQNVRLDASSLLDDSALIAKLAGDDEHKAAMLRAIIGAEDFEQETPKQ